MGCRYRSRAFAVGLASALLLLPSQRSRAESESSPSDMKVTVTVFVDYQGPFDRRAMPVLAQSEKDRQNDVRFVFKNFPLPMHKGAQLAAKAVIAAGAQGKSREMQDKLFANQTALNRADIEGYARDIGLNAARFAAALDSATTTERLNADLAAGKEAGVRGTPTVLVNGRRGRLRAGRTPRPFGGARRGARVRGARQHQRHGRSARREAQAAEVFRGWLFGEERSH
jgi:protein-disulfide isomerase